MQRKCYILGRTVLPYERPYSTLPYQTSWLEKQQSNKKSKFTTLAPMKFK